MKHERINYTLVGAFVVAMSIVLLYTLYSITGRTATSDQYYTVLGHVTGIKQGTTVTFNGYHIGQIIEIEPVFNENKTQFKISMAIRKDWKISADSQAMISKPGLLSDAQINIQEGVSDKTLASGDMITGTTSQDVVDVMKNLGEKLSKLSSGTVSPILEQLKNDIGIFGNTMSTQIPELTTNLNNLVAKLQKNLDVLDKFINADNQDAVAVLLRDAGSTLQNINQLTASMDSLVTGNKDELQQSIEKVNNSMRLLNQKISSIGYHLESSSRNINEFSRQIKENPGIIIRSKPAEDRAVQ